jgi:O-antigen/teichoic acid export membrane protein
MSALLKNGLHYLLMLIYPLILFVVLFAKEWMSFWLNSDFAAHGIYIVYWLSLGILLNSYAQIIYAKIQGSGRADWTAKLHLVEVLPYLVILFFSLKYWGIDGAAFAWFIRYLIYLLGLVFLSTKLSKSYKSAMYTSLTIMSFGIVPLVTSLIDLSLYYRTLLCLATLFIYAALSVNQLKQDKIFNYLLYEMKSR